MQTSLVLFICMMSTMTGYAQSTVTGIENQRKRGGCNKFSGTVRSEWLNDGRNMKLLEKLTYVDPYCRSWVAPTGAIVDGASIPKPFWSIIGGPFEGKIRMHPLSTMSACRERLAPWGYLHLVFYYAMLAGGVDLTTAKIMYAAVYHFGPRWDPLNTSPTRGAEAETRRTLTIEDFDKLKLAIQSREGSDANAISLTEIQSFSPPR